MIGYAALSAARLTEMEWSVSAMPVGDDWRIECHRGEERIIIAIPDYGLDAAMAEAETQARKMAKRQSPN